MHTMHSRVFVSYMCACAPADVVEACAHVCRLANNIYMWCKLVSCVHEHGMARSIFVVDEKANHIIGSLGCIRGRCNKRRQLCQELSSFKASKYSFHVHSSNNLLIAEWSYEVNIFCPHNGDRGETHDGAQRPHRHNNWNICANARGHRGAAEAPIWCRGSVLNLSATA